MEKDLELDQDLTFQRRNWTVERYAWVVMTLILLAALLGLVGGAGLFTEETRYSESRLIGAEYPRSARLASPSRLHIYIQTHAGQDKARLWLHQDFLDVYQMTQITPQPESSFATPDRTWFVFRVLEPGAPLFITLHLRSERPGGVKLELGTPGAEPLRLNQFIFP